MVAQKKIGCMIFSIGDEFRKMAECAVRSFKKFHPDVDMYYIDETNIDSFEVNKYCNKHIRDHYGIFRFAIAAEIMGKNKYDKFIVLGADTITCSRLDEFIDTNDEDMLLTACYPYQVAFPYGIGQLNEDSDIHDLYQTIFTPLLYVACTKEGDPFKNKKGNVIFHNYPRSVEEFKKYAQMVEEEKEDTMLRLMDYLHANSDVICFNNLAALKDVFAYSVKYWNDFHGVNTFIKGIDKTIGEGLREAGYEFYGDQGGLNILAALSMMNGEVDSPLHASIRMPKYSLKFVDLPYVFSAAVYNVRSKKSVSELLHMAQSALDPAEAKKIRHPKSHPTNADSNGKSISEFYVKGDKLFTVDDKQIKVWHYLSGLGINTKAQNLGKVNKITKADLQESTEEEFTEAKKLFCEKVNSYTFGMFNQETRDFFTNQCDCGDFFQKEFKIE